MRAFHFRLSTDFGEQVRHWISARPQSPPRSTEETLTSIPDGGQAPTRRRNVLAAGLVLALGLAGLAYWQRVAAVGLVRQLVENRLAASFERQRELALSHSNAGKIQVQQGDLAGALRSYRDGFAILDELAKSKPENLEWQFDLSALFTQIGDVLILQDDPAGALKSYRDGAVILDRLTKSDSGNATWLHEQAISYERIGSALLVQGDHVGALKSFRDGFAILDRLMKSDPDNMMSQRNLSIFFQRIGRALVAQGDLAGALKSYSDSLAIRKRLIAADRSNSVWQVDLSTIVAAIGGLAYNLVLAHDFSRALEAADQAIAISPNLTWLYTNRAHALMLLGRVEEARAIYLRYRGEKRVTGEKSWETIILEDLAEMRKAGLARPLMDEVEKLFRSANQ
jgi:tetratricopeptide (TPR) repeat protein